MRTFAASAALALLVCASSVHADPRLAIVKTMEQELGRSTTELCLDEHERPYFIGFRLVEHRSAVVAARFGGLITSDDDHVRRIAVDVRVGDYRFDSSRKASDFDFDEQPTFQPRAEAPVDDSPLVLRSTLWLLTDDAYKKALSNYLRKRAKKVTTVEDKHVDSFTREKPTQFTAPQLELQVDRAQWTALARRLSARYRAENGQIDGILDGTVRISADHLRVFLVTSEGTRIIKESVRYSVSVEAVSRAADGMLLDQGDSFYGRTWAEVGEVARLEKAVDNSIANLRALAVAPVADPYTGPAILAPRASGVFFHEAVGHRLEGERQTNDDEGGTFKGQIGTRILPEFITVRDDPTRRAHGKTSLNGFYPFDDEGVPAQNVVLVDNGVLKNYLLSRTPVEGISHSNGHGRAQGIRFPVGRMANLLIESTRSVTPAKLKEMLVEEARRQGKPHGLVIRDITGGSTNTSTYGYQAFKGSPRMVYRVDAKTGEETLVRGVEIVGTPLTAINKIIATSTDTDVFNGYCGAESGYVPVSTVAPATLFREIELQRTRQEKQRLPLLPPPWTALRRDGDERRP